MITLDKNIICDMQHVMDQVQLYIESFESAHKSGNFKQCDLIHAQFAGYLQALYDVGIIPEKQYKEWLGI